MRRYLVIFVAAGAFGQTVSVSANGWTIAADPGAAALTISHERTGALLNDVRLNLREEGRTAPLAGWSVQRRGTSALEIRTARPRAAWRFEARTDAMMVSSTSAEAVLTAHAPAPPERVVVRLMDARGTPVDWVGTNEVVSSYGGSETRNRSYLPARNPEVMYFALGQVSGAQFHSLFDRKSDTAIDFPEATAMERNRDNDNVLDVTMAVPGNAAVQVIADYYTRHLSVPFYVRFDDSYFESAPMVWSSWTSYYAEVREEDIVRNADWLAANLKPYGFEYVQLDDGYDRGKGGEHYWIENWDRAKFPHGPKWLADHIKSKGLRAGLWIVPNAYAGAVDKHPEWYLHDAKGRIVMDYHTPALDSTNPEVLGFLRKMFGVLDGWGFEYYKFDGEHALPKYVPGVDRQKLYDKTIDPVAAYRNRLKTIRETIGPKVFIEGCPAGTPLNGIGYMDSYFNGHDLYNNWQGMYPLFSSINANAFLNHMVVYLMPGEGLELGLPMTVEEAMKKRPPSVVATARTRETPLTGFGTTAAEARTLVTYIALTGVAYPLASIMPELPEERVKLLKATMPTMPVLPMDVFSRGTDAQWDKFKTTHADYYIHNYPEILDLKVNGTLGAYDVVGLTNWRSETATRRLSFGEKLGLDPGASYLAFDFWRQELVGVFKGGMDVEVEPHDTRVLYLHPVLNRPQVLGTSRHITGVYSIERVAWDAARGTLAGTSRTVPGEPYALSVYVPEGMSVGAVNAGPVAVRQERKGRVLVVSFENAPDTVEWEIGFTPAG